MNMNFVKGNISRCFAVVLVVVECTETKIMRYVLQASYNIVQLLALACYAIYVRHLYQLTDKFKVLQQCAMILSQGLE